MVKWLRSFYLTLKVILFRGLLVYNLIEEKIMLPKDLTSTYIIGKKIVHWMARKNLSKNSANFSEFYFPNKKAILFKTATVTPFLFWPHPASGESGREAGRKGTPARFSYPP